MKNHHGQLILILTVLAAVTLACAVPRSAMPTASVDSFSTAVVLTLTAIQDTQPKEVPATDTPIAQPPTESPIPATAGVTETPQPMPAGLRIAYTDAARNLWLWVEGGSNTRLVSTGDVTEGRISPDGNLVAYVRTTDYLHFSMWVINHDGSNERQLLTTDDFNTMKNHSDAVSAQPMAWEFIPGTHKIAFTSGPTYEGPGMMVNDDLWFVDADTGALSAVLTPGLGGFFYFSPDGTQIALVTPNRISLVNANGSNRRDGVLTFALVITYSEYQFYPAPKWSSDSRTLRVAVPPADPLAAPPQYTTLYELSMDGSPAAMIGAVETVPLLEPSISPDLSRIAYLEQVGNPADNLRDLHIANPDGSGDVVYATGQLNFRGWSSDSSHFVFTGPSGETPLLGQVGAGFAPLFTDISTAASIDWLKDGRALVLTRAGGGWELRAGTPGGASALLTSIPGDPSSYFPNYDIW